MSRQLHIVRHAAVVVDSNVRAIDWELSPDADDAIVGLLDRFDPSWLRRVTTSWEKKAGQTGHVLAQALGLPIETRDGLEEHHRCRGDFLSAAAFEAILTNFFARPKEQIFGDESADISLQRFDTAIREIMGESDNDELVVSHGRVISLFVASRQNANPMEIWAALKFPDYIAIDWPSP